LGQQLFRYEIGDGHDCAFRNRPPFSTKWR
jgi:hypothetical protein